MQMIAVWIKTLIVKYFSYNSSNETKVLFWLVVIKRFQFLCFFNDSFYEKKWWHARWTLEDEVYVDCLGIVRQHTLKTASHACVCVCVVDKTAPLIHTQAEQADFLFK